MRITTEIIEDIEKFKERNGFSPEKLKIRADVIDEILAINKAFEAKYPTPELPNYSDIIYPKKTYFGGIPVDIVPDSKLWIIPKWVLIGRESKVTRPYYVTSQEVINEKHNRIWLRRDPIDCWG